MEVYISNTIRPIFDVLCFMESGWLDRSIDHKTEIFVSNFGNFWSVRKLGSPAFQNYFFYKNRIYNKRATAFLNWFLLNLKKKLCQVVSYRWGDSDKLCTAKIRPKLRKIWPGKVFWDTDRQPKRFPGSSSQMAGPILINLDFSESWPWDDSFVKKIPNSIN